MLLVVDNGSVYTSDLYKYLKKRKVNYKVAKSNSNLRNILKHRFKGVIFTGGPLLYDTKVDVNKVDIDFAILLDLSVPIIGICFGHQTIVEAFDGNISGPFKEIEGFEEIHILKRIALFRGLPKKVGMFEAHFDCATRVPYGFEVVAKSKSCKIEAIKHKKRQIYGVQFHPEVSGEQGYRLLDNFLKICKIP